MIRYKKGWQNWATLDARQKIVLSMRGNTVGEGTTIYDPELSNIRDSKIGKNCVLHSHLWISGVEIGDNVKIQAHCFIPQGVKIRDNVFIGPGVTFTNDKYPEVDKAKRNWIPEETIVESGAKIGARAVILSRIKIGQGATIGAGSVVTKDVPPHSVVCGNPAKVRAGKHDR